MNEYTKISLAGVSFNLENDAYSLLEEYLEELSTYYGKEKDGKEIISDIEERIAELFIERKGRERIISKTDVIQIIDTLGRPSEIESGAAKEQKSEQQPVKRKLYRDINNKIIGGVLSGFANFFKTDPVFVRLIYVFITVLFFFMARGVHSGLWFWGMIILYFLLCLIMPPAKTVSQRCAMAGVSTHPDSFRIRRTAPCMYSSLWHRSLQRSYSCRRSGLYNFGNQRMDSKDIMYGNISAVLHTSALLGHQMLFQIQKPQMETGIDVLHRIYNSGNCRFGYKHHCRTAILQLSEPPDYTGTRKKL